MTNEEKALPNYNDFDNPLLFHREYCFLNASLENQLKFTQICFEEVKKEKVNIFFNKKNKKNKKNKVLLRNVFCGFSFLFLHVGAVGAKEVSVGNARKISGSMTITLPELLQKERAAKEMASFVRFLGALMVFSSNIPDAGKPTGGMVPQLPTALPVLTPVPQFRPVDELPRYFPRLYRNVDIHSLNRTRIDIVNLLRGGIVLCIINGAVHLADRALVKKYTQRSQNAGDQEKITASRTFLRMILGLSKMIGLSYSVGLAINEITSYILGEKNFGKNLPVPTGMTLLEFLKSHHTRWVLFFLLVALGLFLFMTNPDVQKLFAKLDNKSNIKSDSEIRFLRSTEKLREEYGRYTDKCKKLLSGNFKCDSNDQSLTPLLAEEWEVGHENLVKLKLKNTLLKEKEELLKLEREKYEKDVLQVKERMELLETMEKHERVKRKNEDPTPNLFGQ